VKDVALPAKNSKESSLEHYACLVCERGDFTLEQLTKKRRDMDNLQKQSILHMILKAIHYLHVHTGMVHCDIKPQNVVKVGDEDRWKLIDFATACDDGDEVPLDYTLRYAAPEVIKAAAAGAASTVRRCSSDMWSLGVMAYELYTGERLFGDMSNEQVAATLAMPGEVPLPGLHNIEPNAARFILKLLVKDPKERWTAEKSLDARFFRSMDDTTKMAASSAAVASSLQNIAGKVDRILDVSLVTLKDMQTGDLLAEIELWEREPTLQRCILSPHDHAGDAFNLVQGCTYIVVVNVFRESSSQPNPVAQVRACGWWSTSTSVSVAFAASSLHSCKTPLTSAEPRAGARHPHHGGGRSAAAAVCGRGAAGAGQGASQLGVRRRRVGPQEVRLCHLPAARQVPRRAQGAVRDPAGADGPAGSDDVADAAAQLRAARDGEGGAEGGTRQAMGERQVHAAHAGHQGDDPGRHRGGARGGQGGDAVSAAGGERGVS